MRCDQQLREFQIALAASGQLTHAELAELELHAATCPSCHACLADMARINRQLFLLQAGTIRTRTTPPGMQERFLKRASHAGLAMRQRPSKTFYPLAAQAAMAAIILTVALSFSWKALSAREERTNPAPHPIMARAQSVPAIQSTTVLIPGEPANQRTPAPKPELAAKHSHPAPPIRSLTETFPFLAHTDTPLLVNRELSPSSLEPGSFAATRPIANPLAASLLASARAPLPDTEASHCFGISLDGRPEEHVCHFQIKLASLSLPGLPQSIGSDPGSSPLKLNPPVFHLDFTTIQ